MKRQPTKNNKGFTLIELLVTMSIIAILSVVAVTSYVGVTLKAARSEAYSNLQNLRLLEEQIYAENACYQPPVGGVCPPVAVFNYTATDPPAANTIESFLRGFRPGGCLNCAAPYGLSFTYSITVNPTPPCFVATATGVAGTRVAGDVFTIDCNNNRNF